MIENNKAPKETHDLNYGELNREQKKQARLIVLTHYFTRYDNTPSDIAFITGYKISVVSRIIQIVIIPGVDLRQLKKEILK